MIFGQQRIILVYPWITFWGACCQPHYTCPRRASRTKGLCQASLSSLTLVLTGPYLCCQTLGQMLSQIGSWFHIRMRPGSSTLEFCSVEGNVGPWPAQVRRVSLELPQKECQEDEGWSAPWRTSLLEQDTASGTCCSTMYKGRSLVY